MDNKESNINLNSYYTGKNLSPKKKKRKKKSRFKKFISNFKKWWKKRKTWQKALFISAVSLFLAIIIAFTCTAVYFFSVLNEIDRDADFDNIDNENLGFTDIIDENIFNIALFGVDSRKVDNFSGQSDSIMILSINKTDNTIRLVSVMRDSLLPYENNGKTKYTKVTEVYAIGGPSLAVKTLNTAYGLDISEYATVNFYGMKDIIDAVGGIEAELTEDEVRSSNYRNINIMIAEQCYYLNIDPEPYYINSAGKKQLNGIQGVAYARLRHGVNIWGSNDDFGRTERQRYVMQQLLDKALNMDITSYPSLIKKLTPYVKTSLSNQQMLSLANFLINKPTMLNTRVPSNEYIINADYRATGASTVYYNYQYAGKVLRAFLYEGITPEDYIAQNGVDLTGWYNGSSSYKPSASVSQSASTSKNNVTDNSQLQQSSTASSSQSSSESTASSSSQSSASSESQSSGSSSENSTSSPVSEEMSAE